MQALANGAGGVLGGVHRVVANHEGIGLVHAREVLFALHAGNLTLAAQLHDAAVQLLAGAEKNLEEVEDVGDVAERDHVVQLETREAQEAAVELVARVLHGNGELVDRGEQAAHALELVALAVDVDVTTERLEETAMTVALVSRLMRAAVRWRVPSRRWEATGRD